MSIDDKKTAGPAEAETPQSGECAWRPAVEGDREFNPFASTGFSGDGRTQFGQSAVERPAIRDAAEDTAPLEGSKDLSDADSLRDVVAAACSRTVKP